jgi:hypothetical protein
MFKLGRAENMPACGTLYDDRQMDYHRLIANISDVPLIGVLDMSKQDTLQVNTLFLPLRGIGRKKSKEHQSDAEKWFEIFHLFNFLLFYFFVNG